MSLVVLGAIGGELMLLLIDKHGVALLEVVNLKVEAMDVAFEFRDVGLSSNNSTLTVISLGTSDSQLFIETSSPIDKSITLFIQNLEARLLCEAFLLPLGECSVLLIDVLLLFSAYILLFVQHGLDSLNISLE